MGQVWSWWEFQYGEYSSCWSLVLVLVEVTQHHGCHEVNETSAR